VHTKFHIRLALRLTGYNKHIIVTIICDTILLNQIAQSNDVGDCSCADPNILVVAMHSGFLSRYHTTTVAFQSHACGGFAGIAYQGCITEKIANTSGKAGAQIPYLPLGDDSSSWGR
jgi:hypothetical protein